MLPLALIRDVLNLTRKASQRVRRFPAEFALMLVILQPFFRGLPRWEVAEALGLAIPNEKGSRITRSAIANTLARLGAEPIERVFRNNATQAFFESQREEKWHGLDLLVMDGTTFRTPNSKVNRAAFGFQRYVSGVESSFPQVRCVCLMGLTWRLILGARFAPYNTSEMPLAETLISGVPDYSVTVFDRGFFSATLLLSLRDGGESRHFVIPAKRNTTGVILPGGTPYDYLVEMTVWPQTRMRAPWLPKTWVARAIIFILPNGQPRTLLTSLVDMKEYPAQEIVDLARRRWEVETAFLEVKEYLLEGAMTLRSQCPGMVAQELWGVFIAYNLLRRWMGQRSLETFFKPTELSPSTALQILQHEMTTSTQCLERRKKQWGANPLEKRPGCSNPRQIKARPLRYQVVHEGIRQSKPYPTEGMRKRVRHRPSRPKRT